ncbi:ABC transporter permease [Photobacterium kishitanii]|uniref:ABC transporter permease n=1 Tax=Photobacterium kishitanii TaxID=318456 RepID=A0A2T3QVS8_9GAMM|nr:ABC transporter permease [Photobacterium kishitanii]KJG55342.1 ABC transporter permease [Photobacterium kishitanii]OBU31022.1 ABC transporter permease [Photobacterium kishitanii]PSU16188.1 ABC transporter permease [Photobacterium kishitanii]PSU90190.1 ABC transporter permease [Photobacterium kishitanii]PSU92389.1 ABC transporter permease [Photobacterium kishitanii]
MDSISTVAPSRWQRFKNSDIVYYFLKDKVAMVCFAVFISFATAALFAPFIAPTNPYDLSSIDIMDSELPPAWMEDGDQSFVLGTDDQGRDIYSTILYGMRLSLTIGLLAVALQLTIGVIVGLTAGYFGGRIDSLLMRIADVQLSFSTMMVAIIVSAIFRTALGAETYAQYAVIMLVVIIGFAEWPQYARTVRASVLAEKKKEYVEAAKVMGFRAPRIMFRHILPNCLSPILVISTVQVANAIMSEAALSFLGLGLPVDQPSLGSLISIGFNYIFSGSWWITAFPGIVLITLVLVINLLGDWLRDVFNPKIYKG